MMIERSLGRCRAVVAQFALSARSLSVSVAALCSIGLLTATTAAACAGYAGSPGRCPGSPASPFVLLRLVMVATPLADIWFRDVIGLADELVPLSKTALVISLLLPGASVVLNSLQGVLVHTHRTRGVIEATLIYGITILIVLGAGILWQPMPGIHYAQAAFTISAVLQSVWLLRRTLPILKELST